MSITQNQALFAVGGFICSAAIGSMTTNYYTCTLQRHENHEKNNQIQNSFC